MNDATSNLFTLAETNERQFSDIWEKISAVARPGAVYSEPLTVGNYTVITASEVVLGGGFGSGLGFGSSPKASQPSEESASSQSPTSGGGGGGGWGGSRGRPVAVISIGPDSVTIKPVVDVTQILLASAVLLGTIAVQLRRMSKARKR